MSGHDDPRRQASRSQSGPAGDALDLPDEEIARDLLAILLDDDDAAPSELPDRTIRKVQNELTSRDLIDLTTFVFLMRFCAPLLDLIAALFGSEPEERANRRNEDE